MKYKHPSELGRKDWHHNEHGQIDYLPLEDSHDNRPGILLPKQKYQYEQEEAIEQGISNLIYYKETQPDWKEYERIQSEFN